jgi:hippurate hydrolase
MLADRLFERFPCDEVYGMHNNPTGAPGRVGVKPGEAMAGADFFDFRIRGAGAHGAHPHQSKDPIVIAAALVGQLQTIVSRNVPPTDPVVLSVTQIHAGAAYNVIPAEATISGTMRFFDTDLAEKVRARMQRLSDGMALAYDAEITLEIRRIFDVLVNDEKLSHAMLEIASEVVGEDHVAVTPKVRTGSEDFADMLRVVPGAYCTIGHNGEVPLHSDGFVLDDDILPVGASIYARLVERRTAA